MIRYAFAIATATAITALVLVAINYGSVHAVSKLVF